MLDISIKQDILVIYCETAVFYYSSHNKNEYKINFFLSRILYKMPNK